MESKKILYFLLLVTIPLANCIYPEYCDDEEDCVLDQVCEEGQCICDLTQDLEYDEILDVCVKKSGASCEQDNDIFDCVQNAFCDVPTKICNCKEGYSPTTSRDCRKSFGEYCQDDIDCNYSSFLLCNKTTRICECVGNGTMIHDPARKSCVSKFGEDCEFQEYMGFRKDCVQNAQCQKGKSTIDSDYSGECVCETGFSNLPKGLCGKFHGESCHNNSDCFTGFCQNTCECPSKSVYDPELQTCRVKAGHHCVKDQLCVDRAECNVRSRKCVCVSDEYFMVDGECTLTPKSVPQGHQVISGKGCSVFQFMSTVPLIMFWTLVNNYL